MSETSKRRGTMSVLEQLRPRRPGRKFTDKWAGEALPEDEESQQESFEADMERRREQELLNRADMSEPLAAAYDAAGTGMRPGPTGLAPEGATPLSPEEFEKRSRFSRVKRPARKKQDEDELGSDEPVDVNAEY